jgi:hypothetical protein
VATHESKNLMILVTRVFLVVSQPGTARSRAVHDGTRTLRSAGKGLLLQ